MCGCIVGSSVGQSVDPGITVAVVLEINASRGVADDEIQRHRAVASHDIGQSTRGSVVGGCVGQSVNPGIAVAVTLGVNASRGVSDGEIQRHRAVAAYSIGQSMRGSVVGGCVYVAIDPCTAVAVVLYVCADRRVADCEVESYDGIAACGVGEGMCGSIVGSCVG